MSFARLHKVITYLLSGFGLYALTLGGSLGTTAVAMLAVGWLASFFVEEPLLSNQTWIRGWTAAVVGVFALQVLRGVSGEPLLGLGIEYAGFLQVSRLFNRRTARDYQQIAVLAFLHLIAATVLSASLSYAVVFLAFVVVMPWMLALSHLRREIEGYYPAAPAGDSRAVADVRRVLASRRVIGGRFLAATALLAIPIFAMTVALFLLFPRVGMGFLSFGTGAGQPTAGFGRNVELGRFGVIRDDPTVVLRVTIPGEEAPYDRSLRMRGTSFDHYDGQRWTRTHTGAVDIRHTREYFPIERWREPDDATMEVVLDHLDEPVIFLPERTIGISIPPRIQGGMPVGRRVFASPGHDFRYLDDDDLGITYTAYITNDPREVRSAPLLEEDRQRYLQLPEGTERIAELARTVTGDARTDGQRAALVERYLRDSGTFTYTLQQPDTRGRDPLEVFLFDARRGHCEYFSTAMAIMLRAVGVPARNVTGFAGGRYNQYGEYYALRQGDAHSWVEAHVNGRWVTFDPTPPARDAVHPSEGLLADVRALFDAIRTHWSRDVVGYDLRAQTQALRDIAAWFRSRGDREEQADAPADDPDTDAGGIGWPWLAALAAALLAALVIVQRRRRGSRSDPEAERPGAEAAALYRDLESALGRRGVARPPTRTPVEHAGRLEASGFDQAAAVREVTERYVAARYGGEELAAQEVAHLRTLIARVGSEKSVRSDT